MKYFFVIIAALSITLKGRADQDTLFFSPQPEDVTALEGYNTTIKCGASSKENITFYWTLDGQRLENDTRRHMVGSNLYISRVSPLSDIGEFKCIATDTTTGRSIISRGAQVNILWITDTAQVIAADSSLEPRIGEELSLHCKAEGNPETQITWYHNGARLFRDERISFKSNQLHILDLTLHDNGIYSCRAINDYGSVNSSENFVLKLSDGTSPRITVVPRSVVIPENSSAQFDCAFDNTELEEWYFSNQLLTNSSRHKIYPNGTLEILFITTDDAGIYLCKGLSTEESYPDQVYAAQLQIA